MDKLHDMFVGFILPLLPFIYLALRMILKKKYYMFTGFVASFVSAFIVTTVTDSWILFMPIFYLVVCFVIFFGIGYFLQRHMDEKRKTDK